MAQNAKTFESWIMANGKPGDVFFTTKRDNDITARANYANRKVRTERVLMVTGNADLPEVEPVVKVTIIK